MAENEKKKRFPKILISIVVILLIVIVAAILGMAMYGGKLVKYGVETGGSQVLGVKVRLEDASLWPLRGALELKNLEIDNPQGYEHPQLLKMGLAHVDLNTSSLFSETVEIEKMRFDNIEMVIEQKGLTSNLNDILKALPKSEEEKPSEPKPEGEKKKDLVIKDLMINGITVKAKLLPVSGKMDSVTLTLDPIHLTDVGTKEKVNVAKLTAILLRSIAAGVANKGKDILPTELLGDLSSRLSEQGMKVLEEAGDLGKGVLEEGKGLGGKATDTFKGLFKKKDE